MISWAMRLGWSDRRPGEDQRGDARGLAPLEGHAPLAALAGRRLRIGRSNAGEVERPAPSPAPVRRSIHQFDRLVRCDSRKSRRKASHRTPRRRSAVRVEMRPLRTER